MKKFVRDNAKIVFCMLVVFNFYAVSFFLIAKPCEISNRAVSEIDGTMSFNGKILYPKGTLLCFSENDKTNTVFYVIYWPIHRFLEWRGIVNFAYEHRSI